MKQFLAIFLGSKTGENMKKWEALDEATRKKREHEGMIAWGSWVEKNKANIVGIGAPLGKTIEVNASGLHNIRNQMAAYTLVQAETHEAAAKIFLSHPHFTIFPGDSVEIMECLPILQSR
jgi:hypothetical protein